MFANKAKTFWQSLGKAIHVIPISYHMQLLHVSLHGHMQRRAGESHGHFPKCLQENICFLLKRKYLFPFVLTIIKYLNNR